MMEAQVKAKLAAEARGLEDHNKKLKNDLEKLRSIDTTILDKSRKNSTWISK